MTRQCLEAMQPAFVEGIPLDAILDLADPSKYADLQNSSILPVIPSARGATGTVRVAHSEPADRSSTKVCCGDCWHFQRDLIGDWTGIGTCTVSVVVCPGKEMPFYPNAPRHCGRFLARKGDQRALT